MTDQAPTILVCCDWYLPGFRAGGPIRSLAAMVDRLAPTYRMVILTRDRDQGDRDAYPLADRVAGVRYVTLRTIAAAIRTIPHDVLYLNSIFSKPFSVTPLVLRWLGLIPRTPVVIAPRGELGAAPLQQGASQGKRLYLLLARAVGLFRGVTWHAASDTEAADIRRVFGDVSITIAPDLATGAVHEATPATHETRRVVFLGRLAPIKHLDYAIHLLHAVKRPLVFDIFGPAEDQDYWARCRMAIALLPKRHTVTYHGPLPHEAVPATLAGYDVMLFPSQHESFGHVILESLLAGVPVLTSDQVPWPDLALVGAGWTIPLSEPERFARVLDDADVGSMRTSAAAYGRAVLDDARATDETVALFRRALAS